MSEHAIQTGRANNAFAECERVTLQRDGKECPIVVLSVLSIDGRDFALVCAESDLGNDEGLIVFGYGTDGTGNAQLEVITDDEIYDEAFHCFCDLFVEDTEE